MAEYVYGKNVVKQILQDSSRAKVLYLSSRDKQIEDLASKRGVPVRLVDKKTIQKLAKGATNHQGVIAEIAPYQTYSVKEIVNAIPEGKK